MLTADAAADLPVSLARLAAEAGLGAHWARRYGDRICRRLGVTLARPGAGARLVLAGDVPAVREALRGEYQRLLTETREQLRRLETAGGAA